MKHGGVKLTVLIIAVFAAILMVSAAFSTNPAGQPTMPGETPLQASGVHEWEFEYLYLVRDFGGNIAIFLYGHDEMPKLVTDIRTSSLPEYDRERLARGIQLQTEEDLEQLLEDYGS